MAKEEKIKCFVPALALEHSHNAEYANLHEKIRLAVLRLFQFDDFFEKGPLSIPLPGVLLESFDFDREGLGYKVSAVVRCE